MRPTVWSLDPAPEEKEPNEHLFQFATWPDSDEVTFLANRSGGRFQFHDDALLIKQGENAIDIDGTPIPMHFYRILHDDEARFRDPEQEDLVEPVPEGVRGQVLIEHEPSREDWEALVAHL